jgi:ElaB/YqjD/DUF883 family membrane-anchored ribosome-binding protein
MHLHAAPTGEIGMDELKPDVAAAYVVVDDNEMDELDTLVADLAESVQSASWASLKTELAQARTELEIANLRAETLRLKQRLAAFGAHARATVTTQTDYVSTSAHAQLGDYPWLKLAAAISVAWLAGRLVRR